MKSNNTAVVTLLKKNPNKNLNIFMIDDTVIVNQKNKEKLEMKINLEKHIDYVPKSKPRQSM